MKEKLVTFENNKKRDYHEVSNLNNKDVVGIFEQCDKLHKMCQEKKIPLVIGFIPSDRNDFYFSASYKPEWDDEKLTKISVLAGGTIKHYRDIFGICYNFDKIDFSQRKV